jgi:hypothetical protein
VISRPRCALGTETSADGAKLRGQVTRRKPLHHGKQVVDLGFVLERECRLECQGESACHRAQPSGKVVAESEGRFSVRERLSRPAFGQEHLSFRRVESHDVLCFPGVDAATNLFDAPPCPLHLPSRREDIRGVESHEYRSLRIGSDRFRLLGGKYRVPLPQCRADTADPAFEKEL